MNQKRNDPLDSNLCRAGHIRERRGQDSNLRTSYPVTDLANRRFRPLSHLSVDDVLCLAVNSKTSSGDRNRGSPGRSQWHRG